LILVLLLGIGLSSVFAQGSPCAFDSIRLLNNKQNSNENAYFYEFNKWKETGQLPRVLPNPDIHQPCNNCLTIEPTITQAKFVVPVIVHVVHQPSDSIVGMGSNISENQILNQIDLLNRYFANEWGGSSSVNTGIQFCLAKVGPDSNG